MPLRLTHTATAAVFRDSKLLDLQDNPIFETAFPAALMKYEQIYNQSIPQRALGHIAPVQALKNWRKAKPEFFHKRVNNHTGLDR